MTDSHGQLLTELRLVMEKWLLQPMQDIGLAGALCVCPRSGAMERDSLRAQEIQAVWRSLIENDNEKANHKMRFLRQGESLIVCIRC